MSEPSALPAKPTVRFYVLPELQDDEHALLFLLVRLLQRIENEGLLAVVRCAHHEQALWLDDMLWAQPQSAFLPHYYLPNQSLEPYADACRIQLLTAPERVAKADVWLDCSAERLVDLPSGCQRVLELVWAENREAARLRYRFYQQIGLSIETHHLR